MFKDLESLRQTCLQCTECGLSDRRLNVVFGEGNPHSPLVLVGEGPGDQEDKSGRPFVGRSGQMLDRALADNGLSRDDVYICNTVKCRAADWSTGKPQNRPPTPEEVTTCRQWLIPQLGLIKPRVILCIGAPSAKNLIKKDFKITKERGQFFPSEFAPEAMAALHPSYIMRQQRPDNDGGYHLLVEDIGKAWKRCHS
ncbi:MAG: uracil-DNA glycosylase [Armatimonadetes bacterium]|nr:uracil-DNA glycosylase [Armatimonadota bacterium]